MNARKRSIPGPILRAVEDPRIDLPDGGSAVLRGGALEVRDARERVIVRYENGSAEIVVPDGDLRLAAPNGKVVLSGQEVCLLGARRVSTHAEHVEVIADKIVQKSRDALREVAGLAEDRVGRWKAIVERAFTMSSRRTSMRSTEETSIDGKRILLG